MFEKKTCGRCGGTGNFSWNARDGSICYGCNGKREVLTKRGAAALRFYLDSVTLPADQIQVGDLIAQTGMTLGGGMYNCRARVIELVPLHENGHSIINGERVPNFYIGIVTGGKYGQHANVFPNTPIRKYWPAVENDAKLAAALAYQDTLTKTGVPRKVLEVKT